jgi:hypothetical protein
MNRREEQVIRDYVRMQLIEQRLHEASQGMLTKALETVTDKIESVLSNLRQLGGDRKELLDTLKKNDGTEALSAIQKQGGDLTKLVSVLKTATPELKEGTRAHRRHLLAEARMRVTDRRVLINESLTLFAATGLVFAIIGGIPLVLKALGWIVGKTKFKSAAEKINKAAEFFHHLEEAWMSLIPNKPLYAVYIMLESKNEPERVANLKIYEEDPENPVKGGVGSRSMTFEEFEKSKLKVKYEKYAYAIIMLPWLISGLTQLHHALHGWLGAVEAAATAEKTLFVGTATADVVTKGAAELSAAAKALSSV